MELTHLMQFSQSEGRQLGTNRAVLCEAHLARLHMFLMEDKMRVLVLISKKYDTLGSVIFILIMSLYLKGSLPLPPLVIFPCLIYLGSILHLLQTMLLILLIACYYNIHFMRVGIFVCFVYCSSSMHNIMPST